MIVACIGDCGVDRYVNLDVDRPGGITLNVAVNAKRLFHPDDRILVLTALGDDREASMVLETIARFGLESIIARPRGRTPVQFIEHQSSGERRFVGYDEGVLATYRMGQKEREIIHTADVMVTTVFAQAVELFRSVMAAPCQGLRAVDFSDLADFGSSADIVERWIDSFHIGFFGLEPHDDLLMRALERLAIRHDKLFVVTMGEAGSVALASSGRIDRAAYPVERVVDTTGAGDTFAAGFLAEYCRSGNVAESLVRGNREASESIQRLGAF